MVRGAKSYMRNAAIAKYSGGDMVVNGRMLNTHRRISGTEMPPSEVAVPFLANRLRLQGTFFLILAFTSTFASCKPQQAAHIYPAYTIMRGLSTMQQKSIFDERERKQLRVTR